MPAKKKQKDTRILTYLIPVVVLIAIIVLITLTFNNKTTSETGASNEAIEIDPETLSVNPEEIQTLEDGTKYIVDPDLIIGGGPPKDGIPSIDNPNYVSVEEANDWIQDDALVLAIEHKNVKRVYPVQIMTWHEIVNDNIAGDPVLITYCPLCGSGIAYEPIINGQAVEFGTSGKLYNSNLVMYDRLSDTYWTQIGGQAIVGPLTGLKLTPVSLETTTWGEWKAVHSDSEVLSTDTGFIRDYTNADGPYANYFANDFYLFPGVQNVDTDNKLANKEFVFGIEVDGVYKAYAKKDVETESTINDIVNGVAITIVRSEDGSVTITRDDTGEEIVKEVDFWFAWFTFHPETELYGFE